MTDDASLVSPSVLHSLREIKQSIWYRIGTLHEDMNDPEAALTAFEKVLVQNPTNAAALAKIGILLMKKECYPEAISYLCSAVSINSENSSAWVALAYSYVMSEELDNAYRAYHTALSKITHHNDPTLWYGIGIMYDRMGLLDHALDAFHAVLNISPHFEAADKLCYDIGLIYKEQHNFELAHKYMSRVVSTKVQQPVAYAEALYQIGHIHELTGNVSSAMESYHSAVTRHPNHVKSLQSLAWLTFTHKPANVEEASRLLAHASQVEPNDANTFYLIGRMAMASDDYHKAYDNYQHAVYRDGKNANFWCAIGILYFHMRQHRDAMDAYTRAIRINPQMPEVWYDMGTLYEFYNQLTDATDAYHRVLQLEPNDLQATERLQILRQAASNGGAITSTPSPLPRTAGPVVSPASTARAHTRSEAPERLGPLPAPPRAPVGTNFSTSAPAPYLVSIPTSQIQTTKPVSTITSVPTSSAQMDQKLGPPRSSPIASAANGIVADSNAYPPVSQGKQYPNGGHGNMIGNGPTGYSNGHDRRSSGPMPPVITAPEASSQLSSLNNQHQNGGYNQSRAPPEPISSRPMGRMPQEEKAPGGISSQQVIHPSQPLNTMPMLTSHINGSPRRGLPVQGPGGPHGPVVKLGEKQDHWNGNDARRNGYGSVARPDSNPTGHIPREIRADQSQFGPRGPSQSHPGSMNGLQRPEYHNEQSNPTRGEPFRAQGDKSPGLRPPQNHQRPTGPVPPNVNSMPSDDRSRLSASSSYERKATPAEALRPTSSKEVTRTSGDGSVRSADENRYGSPASRNSRRSLPAPLLGPPTGFSGRPQGLNMPTMPRGDDHLDEAMLPRLRPLPDNKPNSPRKDRDSKTSVAGNQGGPLAPMRQIDNGIQPGAHRTWNDSHSPAAQRGNQHGTPQQTNGGSPRSQRSPSGGRMPRDQTGPLRPNEPIPSRDPRYSNIQQTDTQQSGRNSAGLNPGNDSSRFQEEGDGGRMKQYSAQASMSPRGSNVGHPSSREGLKGQAPQQPTVMTSETYGGGRPFQPARSGQAESERDQYPQPVQDPNRPNMGASNGYRHGASPGGVGDGGHSSAGGHEMRPTTKPSPPDSHFGSGTPPSFSKPLPRVSASNGLMSAPPERKETDGSGDQNRSYYDRTQGSYGGSERRSSDVSNGYDVSPRGSKRKMSDLVDDRTERSGDKQYPREQGEAGSSDGKAGISGMGRSDAALYTQMPISTQRGDGEDGGHPQKRLRAHGMGEEGLAPLVNGGQLKSRE